MRNVQYEFSSVQVNLPDKLSEEIVTWGKQHVSDETLFYDPDNFFLGREDDPHVTILYGIHANDPAESFQLLNNEPEIKIKLGNIHIFKESYWFDVLTIAVNSNDLERLNAKFRGHLKYSNKHKIYIPHITIAYVLKNTANRLEDYDLFKNRKFTTNEVVFSSRSGEKTSHHM